MRVIIAGGRDYAPSMRDHRKITAILNELNPTEIVSGWADGADTFGALVGWSKGIPVKAFRADWAMHGRSAGPIRNTAMADYADALILLPGGRGTADMERKAKDYGLEIWKVYE